MKLPTTEQVLTAIIIGLIIGLVTVSVVTVNALHDRDVAIQQRDTAVHRQQATDACIQQDGTEIALAVSGDNATTRLRVIGAYLDFGNCLAKIQ